jgi:hypothetical protein
MKSNITIKVEFLAGTEIEKAVTEAKQKAELWQVAYVAFKFNGVSFSIGANADVEDVVAEWKSTGGKSFGICAA